MSRYVEQVVAGIDHYFPRSLLNESMVSKPLSIVMTINGNYRFHDHDKNAKIKKKQVNEVAFNAIDDKSHSDAHDWFAQTENSYELRHPIEVHSDINADPNHIDLKDVQQIWHTTERGTQRVIDSHINQLDSKEKKAVSDYVDIGNRQTPPMRSGSVYINTKLSHAKSNAMPSPKEIVHPNGEVFTVSELDNVISKCFVPHDITIYAGIVWHPLEKINKNGILSTGGFISGTTRRVIAGKYAMTGFNDGNTDFHILEIHLKRGDNALFIGSENDLTPYKDEEVILQRGINLKIDPSSKKYYSEYKGIVRTFHVWNTIII